MPIGHSPPGTPQSKSQDTLHQRNLGEMNEQSHSKNEITPQLPVVSEIKAIKLTQPFWQENPARYFTIAKMTFALHHITLDKSKYRHVIIHLDVDLLDIVGDIIDAPPINGKYEAIKRRIFDSLSDSQETRMRRQLRRQALGDEKPSVFLQRLRNLAAGQCNDHVLRTLFMEQMPEHMRGILAVNQVDDLATLATQADRTLEVTRPQLANIGTSGTVALPSDISTTTNHKPASEQTEITELRLAVEALTRKIERAFTNKGRSRSRSQSRSKNRGTLRRRAVTPQNKEETSYCYYHERFGADAYRCRQPCTWDRQLNNKAQKN
ncbi:uncharacterized protein LOC114936786 [Nylanderia fulva]|uniref:uncharacterized protein LOC114928586 n=1 Tax=Nylanderia fulva TaxID=613905 RepID=UPI0010FAFCA8|nr:uncharacterized protein LOC114928586 [Nylanderia fulva]XP_029157067.1 uncharacterized protein LOC114929652 [Nylanderia fulva]XP_029165934.1 uncharacterized protein LOC114936786 [Nylanderia fulva]